MLARRDSAKDQILQSAASAYKAADGMPCTATIRFLPNADFTRFDRAELGALLASTVDKLWKSQSNGMSIASTSFPQPLKDLIAEVALLEPRDEKTTGLDTRSGWVRPLTASLLQPIIEEKESKLAAYKKTPYDQYWLLIYTRAMREAELVEPFGDCDLSKITSKFDRTFFYNRFASIELSMQ